MISKTLPDDKNVILNLHMEEFPEKFNHIFHKLCGYRHVIPQYMKPENGFDYEDIINIKNDLDLYNIDIIQGFEIDKNLFHSIEL